MLRGLGVTAPEYIPELQQCTRPFVEEGLVGFLEAEYLKTSKLYRDWGFQSLTINVCGNTYSSMTSLSQQVFPGLLRKEILRKESVTGTKIPPAAVELGGAENPPQPWCFLTRTPKNTLHI